MSYRVSSKRTIYYAGLDRFAFPLDSPYARGAYTPQEHIRFIKALSLVVSHIVIPPGFLAHAISSTATANLFLREIAPLFGEGMLSMPIYDTMSAPMDFVDYKIETGGSSEQTHYTVNRERIQRVFSELPLVSRNISRQTVEFKARVIDNLHRVKHLPVQDRDRLIHLLSDVEGTHQIALNRDIALNTVTSTLKSLSRSSFLSFYYALNSAYYCQGAIDAKAAVSVVGVTSYSGYESLFGTEIGMMRVAYDPTVLLTILGMHGIGNQDIDCLRFTDILVIRRSTRFARFLDSYYELCSMIENEHLQLMAIEKISRSHALSRLTQDVPKAVQQEYYREMRNTEKIAFQGDALTTVILGLLGFMVSPATGFVLGMLPAVLRKVGISPAERFLQFVEKQERPFKDYLDYLAERRYRRWLNGTLTLY